MADFNKNLWAPWRMTYIRSLIDEANEEGCFLCRYWEQQPDRDPENRVLWRTERTYVVMNRFPYTNGHLLIAPGDHKGELTDLNEEELIDLSRVVRDTVALLREALSPHGFNIGYNFGRCAGAGLPEHLHAHVVPRWSGDTNFMSVIGDVRTVPDALDTLWTDLADRAKAAGLRT